MERAFISFSEDVEAGFDILHVDTSVEPGRIVTGEVAVRRLIELYGRVWDFAATRGRHVEFEVGVETQLVDVGQVGEFSRTTANILEQLARERLPAPRFVVAQTGTKVWHASNVGVLADANAPLHRWRELQELAATCSRMGVRLKAHNADYLRDEVVARMLNSGVEAINIAPEFAVLETRTWISAMRERGLHAMVDRLIELAVRSDKWRTWADDEPTLTDLDKAELCAHYLYSSADGVQMRAEFDRQLETIGATDPRISAIVARLSGLVQVTASAT